MELIIATKQPGRSKATSSNQTCFPDEIIPIKQFPYVKSQTNILAIKQPLTIFSAKRKIAVNHPSKTHTVVYTHEETCQIMWLGIRIIHLVQNTPQKMTIDMKHQKWIGYIRVSYFWSVSLVRCSCRLRSLIDCS